MNVPLKGAEFASYNIICLYKLNLENSLNALIIISHIMWRIYSDFPLYVLWIFRFNMSQCWTTVLIHLRNQTYKVKYQLNNCWISLTVKSDLNLFHRLLPSSIITKNWAELFLCKTRSFRRGLLQNEPVGCSGCLKEGCCSTWNTMIVK